MNQNRINTMNKLTFAALLCLALGSFTSITFTSLWHIFIIIPSLYFIREIDFKKWSLSQWSLLGIVIVMILSVLFNQDIAVKGYSPLTKIKYYIFGLIAIIPLNKWGNSLSKDEFDKKIKVLCRTVIIIGTFASFYGMSRIYLNFNPLGLKFPSPDRNSGLFGMVLNFAHNLAFLQIFLTALFFHPAFRKKIIEMKWLIPIWIINFVSLYTTFSRGALIAFLAAIPFIFFLRNIKKFAIAGLIAILVLAAGYFVPSLRIVRSVSDDQRYAQWETALHGFKDRPFLGQGYLNFEKMCPSLKLKYDIAEKRFCGHAHNNLLEMLASTGIFGGLLFLLWFFSWFFELYKRGDLLAELMIPILIVFFMGGITQATFTLGANLFFIMSFYSFSFMTDNVKKM